MKVVGTRLKRVLIYSKIENATLQLVGTRLKRVLIYSKIENVFESGGNKIKACSYILKDRECNPATLKVVGTRLKRVLIYSKIENATLQL